MRQPARARRSYLLILLAAVFCAAGLSRLGLGVAAVFAADSHPALAPDTPPPATEDIDPNDIYAALQMRKVQLDEQESTLQEHAHALRAAEAELQQKLDQLLSAEAQLAATLRLTETAAENDLTHLTTVFESMKPAQTAELFSHMDTEFAAGFVSRLRPDFAGEVMSALDPLIAYAISAVLAGRHARTPRE